MDAITVLTKAEQDELSQCEAVIRQGLDTFVQVGQALETIKTKRLYRLDYATFEEYCQVKWDFGRRRANQLISAKQVYNNLLLAQEEQLDNKMGTIVPILPTNENQVAPLTNLPPVQQTQAWVSAVKQSGDKPPTGKAVTEAAATFGFPKAAQTAKATPSSLPKFRPSGSVSVERQHAPVDDFNQASDYDEISSQPVKRVQGFTKEQLVEMLGEFDDFTTCPYCGK